MPFDKISIRNSQRVAYLCLSLCITVISLGTFMRAEFLCVSVLGVASGPRVKLAGRGGALAFFAIISVFLFFLKH